MFSPEHLLRVEAHFRYVADLLAIVDKRGNLLAGNGTCFAQMGAGTKPGSALNIQSFWDALGCISWGEAVSRTADEGGYQTQSWFADESGGQNPVLLKLQIMSDGPHQDCLLITSSNITDLMRAKSQLELQANQDPLTGLFNRRFIEAKGSARR
ncbi:GGDEF domain-containing protein [Rhodobacterales bacterium]|nr:GGDEF domain-containing protein [Rhodobacterales bacterium]